MGAPVEADGTPVYYRIPESFEKAKSDGERWRWALAHAAEADPVLLNTTRQELAGFLLSQFGTQTMAGFSYNSTVSDGRREASGPYALETLTYNETFARLATGVRRFKLPDEFNPIKIYQTIADDPKTGKGEEALNGLASIFENRRQFDRSVQYLERSRVLHGNGENGWKQKQIDQIVKPWAQFEPMMAQPAGRGATVDFRFRNGHRVQFEAHELLCDKLLNDVKDYLSSNPKEIDWQQSDISDIGARVVSRNQQQYVGRSIAQWNLELEPPAGHLDRRITVTTPLQEAGAYLLTATMEGGNTARIIVWLDDTVIVKKPLVDTTYYFVADARTGLPVPRANVELFGWRMVQADGKNRFHVETKSLSLMTDGEGQVSVALAVYNGQQDFFHWLAIARTKEGRTAHLGFTNVWAFPDERSIYNQVKAYAITDRPVYRPGTSVRFKFWIARARYDQQEKSEFAGQHFAVQIRNPKGDEVFSRLFFADEFGGYDGSFELPSDAMLGVYQIFSPQRGGGSFRVEEYKKPEFEVKVDAPTAPVMLGEKITATIKARYYFGGPVAEAKVKYKITRTAADDRWYPAARWDWLFGPGYWWFAADSTWYPGWSRWGMVRPLASWWPGHHEPPELVAEAMVPIRQDGTLAVEIDTALAKAAHPDQDERYQITAEITDQSRRTIVGTGTVLVARQPFRVYTWVDRGHYRVGDTIKADVNAQTLGQKPVAGTGTLRLNKITYDAEGRPFENVVESWDLKLDTGGQAQQVIKASVPGQYRLAATIDDGNGHQIEGGYLLTITRARTRQCKLPLQRPRNHPAAERLPARRDLASHDQHQSEQQHGALVRAAEERRIPAAEGCPLEREEHD